METLESPFVFDSIEEDRARLIHFYLHSILNPESFNAPRGLSVRRYFTTAFGTSAYDWVLHIHNQRSGFFAAPADSVCMFLLPDDRSGVSITPTCRMAYKIYADTELTHLIHCQPYSDVYISPSIVGLTNSFSAPVGEFRSNLSRFLGDRLRTTWRFVISIQLSFEQKSFEMTDVLMTFNFSESTTRQKTISEKDLDVSILCSDEEIWGCSRLLYANSMYFCDLFDKMGKQPRVKEVRMPDYNACTMKFLVEFLHTNAVSPPNDQWSYREADELMKAVEFIKPVRKDEIRQYVHHMLIRAVKRVAAIDLNELVKILLVVNQHNFAQLKTMCYASICNYHYNTFKRRFNAEVFDEEDQVIFRQLQSEIFFSTTSSIQRIDSMWMKINQVQMTISN
ncbi:hypothetical protein M3Y98_01099000 [Aphelenchoides besseyi]|nr:hypothetical protein M3Y98_01099000 [Aphelenchoides besseyi]KAI6209336.1 hypothetical protein M3Y96_00210900 [Aphelenchoides besseyi]